MKVQVQLVFENEVEAASALAHLADKLAQSTPAPALPPAPPPALPKGPRGRPRKDAPPAPVQEQESVSENQEQVSDTQAALPFAEPGDENLPPHKTLDDIRALFASIVEKKSVQAGMDHMASLGFAKVADIPKERYAEIARGIVKLLAEQR